MAHLVSTVVLDYQASDCPLVLVASVVGSAVSMAVFAVVAPAECDSQVVVAVGNMDHQLDGVHGLLARRMAQQATFPVLVQGHRSDLIAAATRAVRQA